MYRTLSFPCDFMYTVVSTETQDVHVSGLVRVDDGEQLPAGFLSGEKLNPSSIGERFLVEKNGSAKDSLIVTLILENKGKNPASLLVSEKKIRGCQSAGFDFEYPIPHGLDGSIIFIAPGSFAAVVTAIRMSPTSAKCFLEVAVAERNVFETSNRRKVVSTYTIPLIAEGNRSAVFQDNL